jgi:hypothetical protein
MVDISTNANEESMVEAATEYVRAHLPFRTEPEIEAVVRDHVKRWNCRARVHNFVAVMAARDARAELESAEEQATGGRDAAETEGWISEPFSWFMTRTRPVPSSGVTTPGIRRNRGDADGATR